MEQRRKNRQKDTHLNLSRFWKLLMRNKWYTTFFLLKNISDLN